ncbi:MAG: tetratricopeptide repeat protein [Candidatus Marinimicrobia bacterium]|nr:tetratricopeptide repeat protein [Candidatus Neomarinimicrobiota bacterium]
MKSFKFILILIIFSFLFSEDDPMGSMIIEYGAHDIIEAGKAYTKQKYVHPDYYEQVIEHVQAGNQLAKKGDYNKAIMRFRIALENDSTYVFAHNGLGNVYLKKNDLKMAEYHFNRSIEFGPTYAFPYNNLANLYLINGDDDKALSYLQTALKYDPNSAYINYNIGNIYLSRGVNSFAQYYFSKALDKDKDFCNAHYNLAIAYKRMKKEGHAISEYEMLVNKCPGHVKGVLNLAAYYIQSKQTEKALILYRQAVLINPQVELYLALGHAYHNEGYAKKEIEAYYLAVTMDSTDVNAMYYLALAYFEQDMIISSIEVCNKILNIDPANEEALELKKKF